jgi:hypothetical protein
MYGLTTDQVEDIRSARLTRDKKPSMLKKMFSKNRK